MEKVGVLVVSYGAREAAIVDALTRSKNYEVDLYIADKQRNPFNAERAAQHVVIPDLDVEQICIFAEKNKDKIDFAIVGPEKPIIAGIRDLVEQRLRVPVICPTKECAIEASKVQQRLLFQEIVPEVNPRFKIFNPEDYRGLEMVKRAVYDWLDILENEAVVKPDKPAAGKGVGVWGDHFVTRKQLFEHFISNLKYGSVIIEEKLDGEETSFQVLSDGKHMVPLPDVRDYKRAFNDDRGPNTGGMGSYKNTSDVLPFITEAERKCELEVATKIFEKWKSQIQDNSALRGVPLYLAFMHTKDGVKILETNSRPGDPEIINILPLIKDDFVEVCFRILEQNLTQLNLEAQASVLIYKVPPNYGGYAASFSSLAQK
ncbi:hypothetical protein KAI12_05440, partial [Candidatus Bathyarchaeota archaeon]|nr:hypothetical protein [Candidatus Bathyarchaeota archaeon]